MCRLVASLLLAVALAACDPTTGALFVTANVVSFVQTDKTLLDHGVSYAQGKDCSTLYWAEKKDYCRDEEEGEDIALQPASAGPYCYRSIGSIVCYREPDPNASAYRLVAPAGPQPSY